MARSVSSKGLPVRCMWLIDKLQGASAVKLWQQTKVLPNKINHTLRNSVKQGCLRKLGKKYTITSKGREALFNLLYPPMHKE